MYVIAQFTNSGVPESGLTPNISIYRIGDNALIVATTTMTEITNGAYKYNFDALAVNEDYDIWVDGGVALNDAERYKKRTVTVGPYRTITSHEFS